MRNMTNHLETVQVSPQFSSKNPVRDFCRTSPEPESSRRHPVRFLQFYISHLEAYEHNRTVFGHEQVRRNCYLIHLTEDLQARRFNG